jgi:signal transduction histidine kinase
MMKKLTTSQRLVWSTTLVVASMMLLLAFVINVFFFTTWIQQDLDKIENFAPRAAVRFEHQNPLAIKALGIDTNRPQSYSRESGQYDWLEKHRISRLPMHLAHGSDERYLYRTWPEHIVVIDVTNPMTRQLLLIRLSLMIIAIASVIAYLVSRTFVRSALRRLWWLVRDVQNISVNNLSRQLDYSDLPDQDEIRILADQINETRVQLGQEIGKIQRFVADASHELRTPLMSMRARHELALATDKNLKQSLAASLDDIVSLQDMIDTLLYMTRHQQKQQLTCQTIDVVDIIKRVIQETSPPYVEKEIVLQIEHPHQCMIDGHRDALSILLRNLLDNAYKYTPAKGTIIVTYDTSSCRVSNTGPAIDPEHLACIWEPFWQADSSRGTNAGFGLGLTLVKQLVDAQGRSIDCESDNKETSFTIHRG